MHRMRLHFLIPVILLLGVLSLVGGSARPALAGQAVQQDKPLRVATKPLETLRHQAERSLGRFQHRPVGQDRSATRLEV